MKPSRKRPDLSRDPNAYLYVKVAPVTVAFAHAPGTLQTLEGPVSYLADDALLTGIAGERWPVGRQEFEGKYRPEAPLTMGQDGTYRPIPLPTRAKKMVRPFAIATGTPPAPIHGKTGDWLVQYENGSHGIVSDAIFQKTYLLMVESVPPQKSNAFDAVCRTVFKRFERVFSLGATKYREPQRRQNLLADESIVKTEVEKAENRATIFSNRYRSAILINFTLGFFAVIIAILQLTTAQHAGATLKAALTLLEFALIAIILGVHLCGRDENRHDNTLSRLLRKSGIKINQGWRHNWVQSRLMAEQFRYTTLLMRFPGGAVVPSFRTGTGDTQRTIEIWENWIARHTANIAPAPTTQEYIERYIETVSWKLEEQIAYHRFNCTRNEKIQHRLHNMANWSFYLTLLICVLHFTTESIHLNVPSIEDILKILLLMPALLPALAACCHGILAGGEFAKIAANSKEMRKHLEKCVAQLQGIRQLKGDTQTQLKQLGDFVGQTYQILISEVVGWHVTLRDKDVTVA